MIELPSVPDSLGELDQWILWRSEYIEGRDDSQKVPYSARHCRHASHSNPRDWTSFGQCCAVWNRYPEDYSGLGFVFSKDDPFAGIDLDDCLDGAGTPKPWVQGILARFADSYMEVSPSGVGIKIFCKGEVPKGVHVSVDDGAIGVYSSERYFAVTGWRWRNAPLQIEDHAGDVLALYERLTANRDRKWSLNPNAEGFLLEKQRHPFWVSVAGTLHNRRVCPEAIEACLLAINQFQCNPPKPGAEDEIKKIVRDSLSWP